MPGSGQNSRDTTDDQGHFRLFGLSPGEYVVSAALRAGGEVTDPAGEPTGYAATYYPGTPNVAEAQRVNVTLGQEASNVAFALTATRLVRVTGAVINSRGQSVTNGMVMLAPSNSRLTGGADGADVHGTDRRGRSVPPHQRRSRPLRRAGPHQSRRRWTRWGRTADGEFGRLDVTVGGDDLDGVVIITGPGARATGQVVTDTGAAATIRPQQVQLAARPASPEQGMPGGRGHGETERRLDLRASGLFDPRLIRGRAPARLVAEERAAQRPGHHRHAARSAAGSDAQQACRS